MYCIDFRKQFQTLKRPFKKYIVNTSPAKKTYLEDTYTGELKFLPLKDWVNLHSESGMGGELKVVLLLRSFFLRMEDMCGRFVFWPQVTRSPVLVVPRRRVWRCTLANGDGNSWSPLSVDRPGSKALVGAGGAERKYKKNSSDRVVVCSW